MSTVGELRELVGAGGLLPADGAVVAMLSGGRDSVCLLDLAVWRCRAAKVVALHVNYGLRAQAAADEAHCRALCVQLGVEIEVVHAAREPQATGNLHAWAREIRYEAAHRLAEWRDATVAVGHTADDQVETILYRLAASPGRRALLGMPERDGRVVRPLLAAAREQSAEYCRERGLSWCDDASNDQPQFARARVRHRLLPALDAVHPAARSNVLRTAALLREETELLEALVDAELAGAASVPMSALAELPRALARLVVIRLAEQAAGTVVPQAGDRVAELVELWRRAGGGELHVGGLVAARIERGRLSMHRIEPRAQRPRRQ